MRFPARGFSSASGRQAASNAALSEASAESSALSAAATPKASVDWVVLAVWDEDDEDDEDGGSVDWDGIPPPW